MLKIQRASHHHRDIAIRFRDSEPWMNGQLFKAFSIALCLHLLGFGILGVNSVKVKALRLHTPVITEAEMGNPEGTGTFISLSIDEHGFLPRHLLEPETSLPILPGIPEIHVSLPRENLRSQLPIGDSFVQIEQIPYVSPLATLEAPHFGPPLLIRISGELAARKASARQLAEFAQSVHALPLSGEHKVVLEVRVNDPTGEVFWAQVKKSSEHEKLDSLAQSIAQKVRFDPRQAAFVSEGEIELFFKLPQDSLNRPITGLTR